MTYYPILKNSNAEMGALSHLRTETSSLVIPIIESKIVNPKKQETWWKTFNTLGTYLFQKINAAQFIYDFNTAFEKIGEIVELIDEEDVNIIQYCINQMNDEHLNFIPCIHFDSPEWIINTIINAHPEKIAVRIRCHDFNTPMEELIRERIEEKIVNQCPDTEFTIILDFYNSAINSDRIKVSVNNFSSLQHERLVLALTNCPDSADDAGPNTFSAIVERADFQKFITQKKEYRNLSFGDYTVRLKPELKSSNINYYNTYLKIFYTSEDDYCIGKSTLLDNDGIETFIGICEEIVESDVYNGNNFSYGDKAIFDCANRNLSITNHSKPIEYGINHHIELTARQV